MRLRDKFERILERLQFPRLKSPTSFRKVGGGAWHDAYLVDVVGGDRLVIRLRKKVIYGRREAFNESYLLEDYASVGLYYQQANRCQPGICPAVYNYLLDSDLTCTVESYLGRTVSLAHITEAEALSFGQQIGDFFRSMHTAPPPLAGFGEFKWNRQGLEAEDKRSLAEIQAAATTQILEQLGRLCRSDVDFNQPAAREKVEQAIAYRQIDREPIALVNGDITPENLIADGDKFIGLIDPVPRLHNALRYASFFEYCYRSYLPNLHDAPRYARHQFHRFRSVLATIADGYLDAYADGRSATQQALRCEYLLWALDVADEQLQCLNGQFTQEIYLRAGDKSAIANRLKRCLQELDAIQLD